MCSCRRQVISLIKPATGGVDSHTHLRRKVRRFSHPPQWRERLPWTGPFTTLVRYTSHVVTRAIPKRASVDFNKRESVLLVRQSRGTIFFYIYPPLPPPSPTKFFFPSHLSLLSSSTFPHQGHTHRSKPHPQQHHQLSYLLSLLSVNHLILKIAGLITCSGASQPPSCSRCVFYVLSFFPSFVSSFADAGLTPASTMQSVFFSLISGRQSSGAECYKWDEVGHVLASAVVAAPTTGVARRMVPLLLRLLHLLRPGALTTHHTLRRRTAATTTEVEHFLVHWSNRHLPATSGPS